MPIRWHETPGTGRHFKFGTADLTVLQLVTQAALVSGMGRVLEVLRAEGLLVPRRRWPRHWTCCRKMLAAQRLGTLPVLEDRNAFASQIAEWLNDKPHPLVPLERVRSMGSTSEIDSTFKGRFWAAVRSANTCRSTPT